jgi:hypothetical protein
MGRPTILELTRFCAGQVRAFVLLLSMLIASPTMSAGVSNTAPNEHEMRFVVVRSSAPGCEPNCPTWISAEGKIVWKTPNLFRIFQKKLGNRHLPLIISSPGGDVQAAMVVGRMVRLQKLDIGIGLTRFNGCSPEDATCKLDLALKGVYSGIAFAGSAYCVSACPLILAGGTRRVAGSWSFVGVHEITRSMERRELTYRTEYRIVHGKRKIFSKKLVGSKPEETFVTNKVPSTVKATIKNYYSEMGVDPQLLDMMLAIPASQIKQLALVEMLKLKLVTSMDDYELLVGASLCKSAVPAENCEAMDK